MDKKTVFESIYKNRFLILLCAVLIMGSLFGTAVLKNIPEQMNQNLYEIVSQNTETFMSGFINRFFLPFSVLAMLYLCGFSILGRITAFVLMFINGAFFGFENGMNYMFSGKDFAVDYIINFFTAAVYFEFLLIIMAESSVKTSKEISDCLKNKNAEKPYYNNKNSTVKFITFTAILAIISAFSAYFMMIIDPIL